MLHCATVCLSAQADRSQVGIQSVNEASNEAGIQSAMNSEGKNNSKAQKSCGKDYGKDKYAKAQKGCGKDKDGKHKSKREGPYPILSPTQPAHPPYGCPPDPAWDLGIRPRGGTAMSAFRVQHPPGPHRAPGAYPSRAMRDDDEAESNEVMREWGVFIENYHDAASSRFNVAMNDIRLRFPMNAHGAPNDEALRSRHEETAAALSELAWNIQHELPMYLGEGEGPTPPIAGGDAERPIAQGAAEPAQAPTALSDVSVDELLEESLRRIRLSNLSFAM